MVNSYTYKKNVKFVYQLKNWHTFWDSRIKVTLNQSIEPNDPMQSEKGTAHLTRRGTCEAIIPCRLPNRLKHEPDTKIWEILWK